MNTNPLIFLDIDGVLNYQLFFEKRVREDNSDINRLDFYKNQICQEKMKLLNELCSDINAHVVISSTWRIGHTLDELKEILIYCGATFNIVDMTKRLGYERGIEIGDWLRRNGNDYIKDKYVIIDDDNDMLLTQQNHFFEVDNYYGLSPKTCHQIKLFFYE